MRLVSRIPAALGHVTAITVRLEYRGTADTDGVDVTDLQLQPGEATGVVPHPSDIGIRTGGPQWRNGIVTRTTAEVIVLANEDRATPTRVDVTPAGTGTPRVGGFRFERVSGPQYADGAANEASAGYGLVPVLTERSDGHVPVTTDRPLHLTVGWSSRS